MFNTPKVFKLLVSATLVFSLSSQAFARSLILAREAAVAILETGPGKRLAQEVLGLKPAEYSKLTASEKTDAFLKSLEQQPQLKTLLAKKSQQFVALAEEGADLAALKSQLNLKVTKAKTSSASLKKIKMDSYKKTAIQRVKSDTRVDARLAQRALNAAQRAKKALGGNVQFLRDGFKECLNSFKPKAVNNANELVLSGANGIVRAAEAGLKAPMKLLNAGNQAMVGAYSKMFQVQKVEAKEAVCTLGGKQCKMWNTGTACL